MSLRPAVIDRFPGLDLRQDPGDTPYAIDALNVTVEPGRVRSRYGTTLQTTATAAPYFMGRARRVGGDDHLIVYASDGALSARSSAGAVISSVAALAPSAAGASGVNVGIPSAVYFYVGGVQPQRWDGTAWSAPAALLAPPFPVNPATGTGYPLVLGVTAADNRMIAVASSTVLFSDPGAPETYATNNYVIVGAGDGEEVCGIANYNNQTFIFKRSKFFVFYGQSTDGTGQPVFNYREVNTGIGINIPSLNAVSTGPDGVYFVTSGGVYRTTGGPPVRVSQPLDPLFAGQTLPFCAATWTATASTIRMVWVDATLYISNFTTTLVYDRALDAWSIWDTGTPALSLCAYQGAAGAWQKDTLLTGRSSGAVYKLDPASVLEAGSPMVSRYRSGFMDLGEPGVKTVRETILEGTGSPLFRWSRDWGALDTGSTVTLGTSPAIATSRQQKAVQGRLLSFQVGASSGAWALNKVQPNLLGSVRPVSVTV